MGGRGEALPTADRRRKGGVRPSLLRACACACTCVWPSLSARRVRTCARCLRARARAQWHLGYYKWDFTPTFRGFESFLGYYEGAEDYFAHTRSGAYDLHLEEGEMCGANCSLVPDRRGEYSVDIFSAEAVTRVENSARSGKPFFIYLAYQSVHSPHQAPDKYLDMYPVNMSNRVVAAMLSSLDEGVANVTAALTRVGQLSNTLIILTSDNGIPPNPASARPPARFPPPPPLACTHTAASLRVCSRTPLPTQL